eukprot:gene53-9646_t
MWYARQRLFCERTLHACGRLLNEWMVDMFCRIDDNRLKYLSSPEGQKKLRIAEKEDLEHYCEDIEAGMGAEADKPGRILLPSSHTGSKRQMWTLFQNACSLSLRKKKATFFDTMTCNPQWEEIKECLHPGQTALDRPDICARVFKHKLDRVLHAISSGKWHTRWRHRLDTAHSVWSATCTKECLEDVRLVWRVYVIEFQQRGLPHAHIVYRVESPDGGQPTIAEEIDRVVQARFPDKDPETGEYYPEDRDYVARIRKHMTHSCKPPPGQRYSKCRPRGWKHLRCKAGCPFPLCEVSHADPRGFVEYRRVTEEDAYVIPHVREILVELDCHYCRKVASLGKILRYLYKYLHKGPDTSANAIVDVKPSRALGPPAETAGDEPIDEIKEYQYERTVGAAEAAWRISGYTNHDIWPTVRALHVDDAGRQKVVVPDGAADVAALRKKAAESISTVDIYFKRPLEAKFDEMIFVDYFESYAGTMQDDAAAVPKTKRGIATADQRDPPVHVYPRSQTRICR